MKKNRKNTVKEVKDEKEVWNKNGKLAKPSRRFGNNISQKNNRKNNPKTEREEKEIKSKAYEIISSGLFALSSDIRRDILRYIQNKKEVTFEELRRHYNMNNNAITFHLRKLSEAYIIAQNKDRGPYQVGPLGSVMLQFLDELEDDANSSLKEILV